MPKRSATSLRQSGPAVAAVVREIPKGQTRSKMEVFRKVLQKLGRGDEGIDTGVRTALGSELMELVTAKTAGWHRVVASDGHLAEEQLAMLQKEGARPRSGESIGSWAKRRGAKMVACYRPPRVCLPREDPRVAKLPPTLVEPIRNTAMLKERVRLSGGKLFHVEKVHLRAPKFNHKGRACAKLPKNAKSALRTVQPRVRKALTPKKLKELENRGATRLRGLLRPQECAALLKLAEDTSFPEVRHLEGEAGHNGAYYFCKHAPPVVEAIKSSVYAVLCSHFGLAAEFGPSVAELGKKCSSSGQKRCATIFLAFGEGGENLAHQDPYGKLFFPFQAVLMLSKRGTDYTGGEFFVKNIKSGEVAEVAMGQGDLTIFAANRSAVPGADFKHGVREVHGERFSVGIVFNKRK